MPEYLTVSDFLANDAQVSKKIGCINDNLDALREQIDHLTSAFRNYVAETDTYRIETSNRLNNINSQVADLWSDLTDFKRSVNSRFDTLEQAVSTLAQTVSQGFTLIFTHLGITSP